MSIIIYSIYNGYDNYTTDIIQAVNTLNGLLEHSTWCDCAGHYNYIRQYTTIVQNDTKPRT